MSGFGKSEKLCSKSEFEFLFKEGRSLQQFPLRLIFLPGQDSETRVAFGVPKRNFKRAVDRNRLKRLLREAYRKNKSTLPGTYLLFFSYLDKKIIGLKEMDAVIKTLLKRLPANEISS